METRELEAIKDRDYRVGVKTEAAVDEKLTKNTQWVCPSGPMQGDVALDPGQGLRSHILCGQNI